MLKDKINVVFLQGQDAADDRRLVIDAMKDGDLDCIIASTIFDEGVDIPILDTLILAISVVFHTVFGFFLISYYDHSGAGWAFFGGGAVLFLLNVVVFAKLFLAKKSK